MNPCIRERKTGKNCYTADDGSDDYVCPSCPFQSECHEETKRRNNTSLFRFI